MGTQDEAIRVGVVGVGYWGSKHVRVLRSTIGVASVIEIDPRLAASRGRHNDGASGYARMEDALSEVNAVVIATPPSSHARLGLQAIKAGKHALIEKPLATTAAEARSIVEEAERAGMVLMPGHTLEHNAAVHKLRELVQGGELGQLFYLDCARLNLGLYQPDVGVIMDLAPHDISIANFVLGSQPTAVTAWGARHVHPEYEDVAHILLDYADIGVRATIHVSWLNPLKVRKVTAVGSRKMATFDDLGNDERVRLFDKAALPLRLVTARCPRSRTTWAMWSRRSCPSPNR